MDMKLILRGRTIEGEPTVDAIFKILGDKYSRKIPRVFDRFSKVSS